MFGVASDVKRFVDHRPYFIFAYESQLTIQTICNKLIEYYVANNTPVEEQIDAVFCLDRGEVLNMGDGEGLLKWRTDKVESISGIHVTKDHGDEVLLGLMFWLSIVIQRYSLPHSPLVHYLLPNEAQPAR